jgi:hypothetical protein
LDGPGESGYQTNESLHSLADNVRQT